MGNWLQRDPEGYVDGLSLYGCFRNSPLAHVDPDGRLTILSGGGGAVQAGGIPQRPYQHCPDCAAEEIEDCCERFRRGGNWEYGLLGKTFCCDGSPVYCTRSPSSGSGGPGAAKAGEIIESCVGAHEAVHAKSCPCDGGGSPMNADGSIRQCNRLSQSDEEVQAGCAEADAASEECLKEKQAQCWSSSLDPSEAADCSVQVQQHIDAHPSHGNAGSECDNGNPKD